jgi:ankyrin repeat protein
VGRERFACGINACTFTASRKDNLQQHHSRRHGLESYSKRIKPREKPCQLDTIKNSHTSDATSSHSLSVSCLVDGESWTCAAFLQAATAGNLFSLGASLNAKMDVNVVGDDGSSALHCAARAGRSSAVQYLLEHGADCEARNNKQRSPLHEALLSRDLETVDLLLHHGAKSHSSDVTLDCLGQCGNIEILWRYLTHFRTNVTQHMLYEILNSASRAGHISIVTGLLSLSYRNADHPDTAIDKKPPKIISETCLDPPNAASFWMPETSYWRRSTPLHLAAAEGHLEIVQLLMEQRFDINATINGFTPLHRAACGGHASVVEFLLNHKAIDIKCEGRYGLTPLHLAARNGKVQAVRLLLSHIDFDVGQNNRDEVTPLHLAAGHGHLEVVQLLLQHPHHQDSRCPNSQGHFPLQWAALRGHWEVAQVLLDHECMHKTRGVTVQVQEKSHTPSEILKRLLEHPDFSDINLHNMMGHHYSKGLLHAAIRDGNHDCVRILLCHSEIDVNLGEIWCLTTPLILAAELGRTDAVELLLQHKNIDINKRTGYTFETALQVARKKQHSEIVDLLLANGAIDYDNTVLSSGNDPAIADSSITVYPQPERTINHDLGDNPYISKDEQLDSVLNCMEHELELPTTKTTWLDTVLGGTA